jgi:iron complex transport system substrate-binding protein
MRIVSLLPSATEIVAALGYADSLVGRSHECDHPATVSTLPPVTATAIDAAGAPSDVNAQVRALAREGAPLYTVLAEQIEALAPDVIVTQALCAVCAVSESDVRAIAARSPTRPRVVTLAASTFDGVVDDVVVVAEAIGAEAAGVQLVASLRARLRAVHDRLAAARAPRPAVAVIEWTDPLFVAGHWVPEMIYRAGGRDVVGSAGAHSTVVSSATIDAARPDVVLVAPCGYDVGRAAAAARTVRVAPGAAKWAIDANALLSRPGPRLVDGVETVAAILHPALFPSAPTEWAIRIT